MWLSMISNDLLNVVIKYGKLIRSTQETNIQSNGEVHLKWVNKTATD